MITPAGPDKSLLVLRETKISALILPRPSDQRCGKERLVKKGLRRPMIRRAPVAMRVEVHLTRSQRLAVQRL